MQRARGRQDRGRTHPTSGSQSCTSAGSHAAPVAEPRAGHLSPKYMDVRDVLNPFSFLGLRFRRGDAGVAHIWISKQKRSAAWREMRSKAREDFADGAFDAPRARSYLDSWVASHGLAEVCANSFWVQAADELELAGWTAQRVQQQRRR